MMINLRTLSFFASRASEILASRQFVLLFGSVLAVLFTLTYSSLDAAPQSQFFTISTLGSEFVASYYPNDNLVLSQGDSLKWNVQVYNHMGNVEYVSVRVKLLGPSQYGPDDNLHVPSTTVPLYEERHMVANNSTWTMPLDLAITGFDQASSTITSASINGKKVENLNISSNGGIRVIVELWRYDIEFQNFVFTWPAGADKIGSAWNQIWIETK